MPYLVTDPFHAFGADFSDQEIVKDNDIRFKDWPAGTLRRRVDNGFLRVLDESELADLMEQRGDTQGLTELEARVLEDLQARRARADAANAIAPANKVEPEAPVKLLDDTAGEDEHEE